MIQFSIFRIPVAVHWSFFLVVAFLGGGLSASNAHEWQMVFTFMLAAFISIVIHELGHAFTGLKLGAHRATITLMGMGGVASFPGSNLTRWRDFAITAAGPLSSLLLAMIALLTLRSISPILDGESRFHLNVFGFLRIMVFINIFWTLFNLCPLMPLDGGRMMKNLVGYRFPKISAIIGFAALIVMALALWFYTGSIYNMILIVVLGMYHWKAYQYAFRN